MVFITIVLAEPTQSFYQPKYFPFHDHCRIFPALAPQMVNTLVHIVSCPNLYELAVFEYACFFALHLATLTSIMCLFLRFTDSPLEV